MLLTHTVPRAKINAGANYDVLFVWIDLKIDLIHFATW